MSKILHKSLESLLLSYFLERVHAVILPCSTPEFLQLFYHYVSHSEPLVAPPSSNCHHTWNRNL